MELWLTYISIGVALLALSLSGLCFWLTRKRHRHRPLERQLQELASDALTMREDMDKLQGIAKRAYARKAMAEKRASGKINGGGMPDPRTDPDGWKRHMQRQYALGDWKP